MTAAAAPEVLHELPGRLRLHVPAWNGAAPDLLESTVAAGSGIRRAQANARTRNVLVEHEPSLSRERVLHLVADAVPVERARRGTTAALGGRARRVIVTHSSARRARIAVHGLDRDPELGRRLVERVERLPGVRRVIPSPLTGRVLVELEEVGADLQEVIDEVGDVAAPPEEHEVPAHPLDPAPIIEGAARLIGAGLGLALLTARRATGITEPLFTRWRPGDVASALVVLEGVPPITRAIEHRLGHERKELLFAGVGIVAMTSAGGAVGLVFAGVVGGRALTEATARRSAWRSYEARVGEAPAAYLGAVVTLDPGRRAPMRARVVDGAAIGQLPDGSPARLRPGSSVAAGTRIHGSSVTVELVADEHVPRGNGAAPRLARTPFERYVKGIPAVALAAGVVAALVTRSPARGLTAVLLLNPRPALAGADIADRSAAARVLRSGATMVGSRPDRPIRRPDVLLLDGARVLCDGWELRTAVPCEDGRSAEDVTGLAAAVAASAGSHWGHAFPADPRRQVAADGEYDGRRASANIGGERWHLGPAAEDDLPPGFARCPDDSILALTQEGAQRAAGIVAVRPRLAGGADRVVRVCRDHRIRVEVVDHDGSRVARAVAERAGVDFTTAEAHDRVAAERAAGCVVAVVGDGAASAAAFDAADLAIGLTSGHSGRFGARADLVASRLETVEAVVDAGVRRDLAVRDATAISILANALGTLWMLRTAPAFSAAGRPVLLGGLVAMLDAIVRETGGRREREVLERLADPLPERWGRLDAEAVLQQLGSQRAGLSWDEAERRWSAPAPPPQRRLVAEALVRQLASPLVAFLAGGAALSLAVGAVGDAAMVAAVVGANAGIGAWQERRAGNATRTLQQMGPPVARVWRAGHEEDVPTRRLVVGDVLSLVPGDRIGADARVLDSHDLEVDEAALTGESLPVGKSAANGTDASRVVLEGTDVTAGTGRAVVVAVGDDTRMGAIAAALGEDAREPSALDTHLGQIMGRALPYIAFGGGLVAGPGMLLGRPAVHQLALGASVAIAAVPEGLPLLAGVAEATVARRLARRRALVTRLSSIEALGRVDVACVDKTGTLTSGRLALRGVADPQGRLRAIDALTPRFRRILQCAAIASPRPGRARAKAHPTDAAVLEAARVAGIRPRPRAAVEAPFDPARGFHATAVDGRVCVKGAVEVLAPRCGFVRTKHGDHPLDDRRRQRLLRRAADLAHDGLRVLLVAESRTGASVHDPRDLVAVGFVALGDPVRSTSVRAVQRCFEAGVRVMMLTGDHPATARAVAQDVGLPCGPDGLLTGGDLAGLDAEALRARLEGVTVIARSTPMDKLRIVDALRRAGHAVAMTGDGVNDAPALRLADVGVAMGRHGTEVARHAADLVLTDDDFATLVEALIEGRGFWRNLRRALGILLGGNAGEVATMAALGLTPLGAALTTRQVLTVNLVSDVLPAMAVAMRAPDAQDLAALSREGGGALNRPLRDEVLRRAVGTAVPSVAAAGVAAALMGPVAAAPVAFVSVMGTQLGQALAIGRADGRPDPGVTRAVGASGGGLALAAMFGPTRRFLGLSGLGPTGLALSLAASAAAPVVAGAAPNVLGELGLAGQRPRRAAPAGRTGPGS